MTEEKTFTWAEIEEANGGVCTDHPLYIMHREGLEELRKRLHSAPERKVPRFGIYNDLGYDVSMSCRYETTELGLDEECIMLESSREGFDPRWTPRQFYSYHAFTADRQKTLTVWPEPTLDWFNAFTNPITGILSFLTAGVPVFALDLDAEMRMKERFVDGFASLDSFGENLMDFCRGLKEEGLIQEIHVNTFPGHREAHGTDSLDGEDMFYLQSYPINKKGRTYDGRYGPTRRTAEDFDFVREKGHDEALSVVLPAWAQKWPMTDPVSAMGRVALTTSSRPYQRYRWWSLKHAVGPKKNSYAAQGIKNAVAILRREEGWNS